MVENWKASLEFPDYEVSDCGRVRRITPSKGTRPQRIHKVRIAIDGYDRVTLRNEDQVRDIGVHRLVAMTWVDGRTPDRNLVNHIDGVKTNNQATNLEWCSQAENIRHASATGLSAIGSRNGSAQLTESDVVELRLLAAGGTKQSDLARRYGVSENTISNIVRRRKWRHVA